MKLTDLEPEWITLQTKMLPPLAYKPPGMEWAENQKVSSEVLGDAASLAEAQGIWFICPVCRNHQVMVAFRDRGVLDHQGTHNREGAPSRWQASGTGFADLTLSPSVDCGCWHGFITNGEIT